jgi:DNA-binding CsgD family transcriptional regulator
MHPSAHSPAADSKRLDLANGSDALWNVPGTLGGNAGPAAPRRITHHDDASTSWSAKDLWSCIVKCELQLAAHLAAGDRLYLVAEGRSAQRADLSGLSDRELAVLRRLLIGYSQKATSYELGLSPSTVATHAARAFGKMNLVHAASSVPLALVQIGQAACGAIELRDARVTASIRQGVQYVVANVPRPPQTKFVSLTYAEREVALGLVDGLTKSEIAKNRGTSIHTIGRQISSLFAKLKVKGRFDLIRLLNE